MEIKRLFFPACIIYSGILSLRHWLYDRGILHSAAFEIPLIDVGNLNLGGAGKTPMVEYLVSLLLQEGYKVAVLSRGYKRRIKGFVPADDQVRPSDIGDEPYQIYHKFRSYSGFFLSVDANRKRGIEQIVQIFQPDVILLDDAFQHRKIKAGLDILLTPFYRPFYDDNLFPCGNLRDLPIRAKKAGIIVVTKTSKNAGRQKEQICQKLQQLTGKPVFFSFVHYGKPINQAGENPDWEKLRSKKILLVTGIAQPEPLYAFLRSKKLNFVPLKFPDHVPYDQAQVEKIKKRMQKEQADLVLTTEKDFHKIKNHLHPLFYVPIEIDLENQEMFNSKILHYVKTGKFV